MQPPQISLQPGSTNTAAVKQLQDWLVSQGYMTEAQKNTGYGTYGPQTTQAVQAVQQKLGIDSSTGPGYWGPRTITAINTAGNGATAIQNTANQIAGVPTLKSPSNTPQYSSPIGPQQPTGTPPMGSSPTTPTNPTGTTPINTTQTTPTTQSQANPQLAMIGAIGAVNQNSIQSGQALMSAQQAWSLAEKDPNIVSKYADMARLDAQAFTQQLQQAQQLYSSSAEQYKTQFENERKMLAEKQAAAGTAYSGFRGKAQKDLAQQESGIVTSTRAQQQSQLQQLTSQFESKYGTGATPQASITAVSPLSTNIGISGLQTPGGAQETISAPPLGGITGTQTGAKQADIANKAYDIKTLNASPL